MTTQRPPVSIASVLLQILDGSGSETDLSYPASDLPAMVALRSSGCITPKVGTIVAELSKLKKAGLVSWRAAEGRRPKDSRGARWTLTARGMERAAEEQCVFLGMVLSDDVTGGIRPSLATEAQAVALSRAVNR